MRQSDITAAIAKMRQLEQAATPGLWEADGDVVKSSTGLWMTANGPKTAALVAQSRNVFKALLDCVEAMAVLFPGSDTVNIGTRPLQNAQAALAALAKTVEGNP